MKEIINEIADSLKKAVNKKSTKIGSSEINTDFFRKINDTNTNQKIAFIDGGNAPIIESPNLSVQFIRLYASICQHNKKIKSLKHEFFSLIQITNKFSAKLFPLDKNMGMEDMDFVSRDKGIESVASCIRRIGELLLAEKVASELKENDIIVIDGNLQSKSENEKKYLNKLLTKNIIIGSVAKTNQLITNSGDLATSALSKLTNLDRWYYSVNKTMFIGKLHKLSKYIFVFELNKNADEFFSLLAENSKDPVFLGYPYGLVDADKNARVSNNEKSYLKTLFSAKIDLSSYENNSNAHDVLDSI